MTTGKGVNPEFRGERGLGVYVHVPFCARKCPYCAFYSKPCGSGIEDYLRLLAQEVDQVKGLLPRRPDTLYVGGGTPSLLSLNQWERMIELLSPFLPELEWTVEANPESFTAQKARMWRQAGVHRVSLGVQSLQPELLRALGRLHGVRGALQAVDLALEQGFRLSCDLMFGLPGGSARAFRDDCLTLVGRGVEHLSIYQLSLEPETPWGRNPPQVSDGESSYIWAQRVLPRLGLEQYEVASFAVPGQESRHNGLYWQGGDVVPLGPSAWGYGCGLRMANGATLESWAEGVRSRRYARLERLSGSFARAEAAFLALRTRRGIDLKAFATCFGPRGVRYLRFVASGWPDDCYRLTPDRLLLTPKGLRLGNALWCDLL